MTNSEGIGTQISQLRREHAADQLLRADLKSDPFEQFAAWMEAAVAMDMLLPNAMTLATADAQGRPSARVTLLKSFDDRGFVFFTNRESHKGRDLAENPYAALVFYWGEPGRQIRIEGTVHPIDDEESYAYFKTRSRGSQVGAWASRQSQVIANREMLEDSVVDIEERFQGQDITLPPYWGGYRLVPSHFEFWNGQPSRLHDRFAYSLQDDGSWLIERLSP